MISARLAAGSPVTIASDQIVRPLQRVVLGAGQHSEAWLQQLVHDHPALLPITQIEPAFHDPIAIACEVPCGHGFIDNLLVTPRGDIIIVEAKLWKNPQARREMLAQVLDYVAALMSMTYDAFAAAITKGSRNNVAGSLYDLVRHHGEAFDEATFIDAVSANLARGRILALYVGDGIRGEARALTSLLQSHAGAHFTLALVELGIWQQSGSGELLCLPSVLTQTIMIERGIVRMEGGSVTVASALPVTAAASQPHTISDTIFMEALAAKDPLLPNAIAEFLKQVEPLGVYADQKAALSLKADGIGPKPLNLGVIDKTGKLYTDHLGVSVPIDLTRRYASALATLIDGQVGEKGLPKVTTNGTAAPLLNELLPQHANAWADIIQQLLRDAAAHFAAEAA